MTCSRVSSGLLPALVFLLAASSAMAAQENTPLPRQVQGSPPEEDRVERDGWIDYLMISSSTLQFANIGAREDDEATIQAVKLVAGANLSDHFFFEGHIGRGITDDDVLPWLNADVELFGSMYIGGRLQPTSRVTFFAKWGFTGIKADVDKGDPANFNLTQNQIDRARDELEDINGNLVGNSFSISWLAGMELHLINNLSAVFEGGTLHKDNETDIDTRQFNAALKYTF